MWQYLTKAANSIKGLFTHRPPTPSPNVMSTADPPPPDLAPDPLIILDATTAPISTHNLQTRTLNLLIHRRLSRHLPNELVLAILDHAHTYLMLPPISLPRQTPPLRISEDRHSIPPSSGDKIILATPPLTQATIRRIRKITIKWLSKDQGWSSYPEQQGTYDGSWTYFDVALQPAISAPPPNTTTDPDYAPTNTTETDPAAAQSINTSDGSLVDGVPLGTRYRLQHNRHAWREMELYQHELERGEGEHEIFEEMKEGDRICFVGCARFPGWMNLVEAATLLVSVVDDLGEGVEGEGGEVCLVGW